MFICLYIHKIRKTKAVLIWGVKDRDPQETTEELFKAIKKMNYC